MLRGMVLAIVMLVGGSNGEGQPGRIVLRQGWPEAPPNSPSSAVSGDGRYVAFVSAVRLLPLDTNTLDDIYILERASGRVTLATQPYSGVASDGSALNPQLNANGRYLAFNSLATVLTGSPDRNEADDVFVRDGVTGVISRVSVGPGRQDANGRSAHAAISDDGRWVVFESTATNLVPHGDANGTGNDVYLADLGTATLTRISEPGGEYWAAFSSRCASAAEVSRGSTRTNTLSASSSTRKTWRSSAGSTCRAAASAISDGCTHSRSTTTACVSISKAKPMTTLVKASAVVRSRFIHPRATASSRTRP